MFKQSDFLNATSDEKFLRLRSLIAKLASPIKDIFTAELKRGNIVVDLGENYPDKGSIHVTLRDRFDDRYASTDAIFSLCDDPHYWHADYTTAHFPRHLLIC